MKGTPENTRILLNIAAGPGSILNYRTANFLEEYPL